MNRRSPAFPGASPSGRPAPRVAAPPAAPTSLWGLLPAIPFLFLWVFAFAPKPQVLATVPAVVAWMVVVESRARFRTVALVLLTFGALATGYGYRWLAPTTQLFGGLGPVAAWATTALFGVVGTVHGIVFIVVYRGMVRRGVRPHPITTALLFVACECLPIRLFPWMAGHGAVDVPPLVQVAELGGVPAVSFAVYCLVLPVHELLRWVFVREGGARPQAALVTFLVGAGIFGWGLWRYRQVLAEEAAATDRLRVAIVQPDQGSLKKRAATRDAGRERQELIEAYHRGSLRAAEADPDLVVWPETAITDRVPMEQGWQTNLFLTGQGWGFLGRLGEDRAFLVGLYEAVPGRPPPNENPDRRYNAAALREPGGDKARWQVYRKVYLIPFGEMTPWGLLDHLLPQGFHMVAASMPQDLLEVSGRKIACVLCYEGILPDHVRACVQGERPDLLVGLANDSWFGDTWEPWQHLNFTRFRAVEHRVPLVRATNTGVSAFVSATGDVAARLGVGVEDVLVADVPMVARPVTPYVRWGHHLPVAAWVWVLLVWLTARMHPPPVFEA